MKLTDRQYMNESRYSQSFAQLANRTKHLNSTSNTVRLPQLSRSFSSSSRNNQLKMALLEDTLNQIDNHIRDLRLQTRQSKRYTNFLKDDLIDRRLANTRNDLAQQLNTLDKLLKFTKKNNEDNSFKLKDQCRKLNQSTNHLSNLMVTLDERMNKLQNAMGIYNGKQKHKF